MRRKTGRLIAFGLVICLLAWAAAAAADGMHREVENAALEADVRLGYDGRITYGKPVPVRVTIRNAGEDLEGTLAVNAYVDSEKYDRFETGIFVPAGGERTFVLPVTANYRQETFTAEILRNGQIIRAVNAKPESVINPSAMLVGLLSSRPRNLANLDISQENDALMRYEYWQTVPLAPETLPEDPELLDAFGMIVLDDTDPALLTEKQKNALTEWIGRGHVLLCGGGTAAPRNLSLFEGAFGLRAEEFTVSGGVKDALESYAERKTSGNHPEITLARITGGVPMISDQEGNGLVWRETAGAGRVYVLAWEAGDAALNTESLMHFFYQQMLIKADANLYNNILYSQSMAGAFHYPGEDSMVPVRNTMLPAAALIVAAMLAGGAAWILLQRRGAAKWMWLVIPALALASSGAVLLLSGGSTLNRPVASAAVNLVQDADGKLTRYTGVTAASPEIGIHRYYIEGEDPDVLLYDSSYWDEEEEIREPVTLRVIRTFGEQKEIAVNAASHWETTEMKAARAEKGSGRVEAEIWMEEDGLHGTIRNGTSWRLKEGAALCVYGFARIRALAPGESADFAMIAEDAKDPLNPVFRDGIMIRNASAGLYSVANTLWFGEGDENPGNRESELNGMLNAASDLLSQESTRRSGGQNSVQFLYCAEPENPETPSVYADGKAVENYTVLPLLTAEISYLTVGRTGVVFHAAGTDPAVRCVLNEKGLPEADMPETDNGGKYYYNFYPLNELPTFRFAPEDIGNVEITRLVIGMEEWYLNELKCYVLNAKQRIWVEVRPNTALQRPEQYLDRDGNLYCQFRPASGESYTDIPAPTLILEGRVKNAEP